MAINKGITRRNFLLNVAGSACGATLLGAGLSVYSRQVVSMPALMIRPPGALAEEEFLGACVRCGQCVRDCPYDILHLASLGETVPLGSPYFVAREQPCRMCMDIPCVKACPTGALDHSLENIDDARMGLAVLVDEENCLAFRGMRCEVCFHICPLLDEAITIDLLPKTRLGKLPRFVPVVHSDACTGCGMCEGACVLQESAIKVFPRYLALGKEAGQYRYDDKGEKLVNEGEADDTPFSSNPLETIKSGRRSL
ncbi:Ferredoxin-type protein NapG (periplasmic nitrate reductase) [hydrothermal vent metagenome]|uniref:Ferredoxin-type protein NapG (Periplasmic nitrate reductase) n=1 Tax=hydrothermal vent metagenome TaxID=652676 RepID=A0A3B1ARG3_9ZZZZ